MNEFDIFISYSHNDTSFVDQIIEFLSEYGFRIWKDDDQIMAGEYIIDKIHEGINKSSVLISIVSESYLNSNWCKHEAKIKLTQEVQNSEILIIPLKIDLSNPSEIFPGKYYLDFSGDSNFYMTGNKLVKSIIFHLENKSTHTILTYFDNPKMFNKWSPQREIYWNLCEKMFWFQYIALELPYAIKHGKKAQLSRLRASKTIDMIIGGLIKGNIRNDIKGWDRKIEKIEVKIRNQLQFNVLAKNEQIIEINNAHYFLKETLEQKIQLAINKFSLWRETFRNKYFGIANQHDTELKVYKSSTPNSIINVLSRPMFADNYGDFQIHIEYLDDEKTLKHLKNLHRYYILDRLDKLKYDYISNGKAIFILEQKEIDYSLDLDDLISFRESIHARAEKFFYDRLKKRIVATPNKQKCHWCKFLKVCQEGCSVIKSLPGRLPIELKEGEVSQLDLFSED